MLPANQRLRENRDYRQVYARGRAYPHPLTVLYVARRAAGIPVQPAGMRIGFVVSKKQGDAVVRNRIKRRLREAVRLRLADLRDLPVDVVFIGRAAIKDAMWPEIDAAVTGLARQAKLTQSHP